MKKVAVLSIFLSIGSFNNAMETGSCAGERPYLMLFVDINKTIIAEDKSKAINSEGMVASLLSEAPEYAYTWGNDGEVMTYYKWVNKQFPGTDPAIKAKRETYQAQFVDAAQEYHHPQLQAIKDEYESLVNTLKNREPRKVVASFSNLVDYLRKNNYSFSIILRTFGPDLGWVSEELAQDDLNDFIRGSFQKGVLNLNGQTISNSAEMIATFKPGTHYAIRDNYDFWKDNNFTAKGGKPFPIDISNKKILSIFYDDNAADPVKPILHVIPVGATTHLQELLQLGRVVSVDIRKAIGDKDYFINTVKYALKKWQEMFCPQEVSTGEMSTMGLQ